MQTLYLNIEYAVAVELCAGGIVYILSEFFFILEFYCCKLVKNFLVVSKLLEVFKLRSVLLEAVADAL